MSVPVLVFVAPRLPLLAEVRFPPLSPAGAVRIPVLADRLVPVRLLAALCPATF